jgi:hypothetical protein
MTRLLFIIWLLFGWNLQLHAEEPPAAATSALPSLRLESLSATRERPLFAPARRRPTPLALPVTSNPDVAKVREPQLTLRGIIVSPLGTRVLLRDDSTSESVTVHAGNTIGRWHVLVDSNYSVKLKDGADEIKLEMFAAP